MGKGFTPLRGFVPVSLKWTHLDQPKLDFFPQGSSRFLDFGLWSWVQGQAHPALFLSTEVALRMGGSTLHSAKYRCQITVTGRDGMYHRAWWSFEFADNDARYGEHNIKFIGFKLEVEKILAGAQLCKGPMGCACTRH